MSQSVRIQFIIRCLNHKGGVSLNEITSAFEVSRRQAARDIEYLRDQMHAPVSYNWKTKKYQLTSIWESYTNTDERMIIMGAYLKSLFAKIKLGKYFEDEIMTVRASSNQPFVVRRNQPHPVKPFQPLGCK